jgi:hypothetical protein
MGGIDEAALDRLSLVTEMTKHIRVRAGSKVGRGLHKNIAGSPQFRLIPASVSWVTRAEQTLLSGACRGMPESRLKHLNCCHLVGYP